MYRLQVLRRAENDILKSVTFYNKREQGLGDRFFWEVVAALRRVEAQPLHYPEKYLKKFRFALIHDFPFFIVFKIKGDLVVINSVFHTSRNPKRFS